MSQGICFFLWVLIYFLFHVGKVACWMMVCFNLTSEVSQGFNYTVKNGPVSGQFKWSKDESLLSDMKDILVFVSVVLTVLNNPLKLWHQKSNIVDDVLKPISKGNLNAKLSFLRSLTKIPPQTSWVFPSSLREYVSKSERTRKEDCMNFEWGRYESFKEFPLDSPARATRLASSGFFYTGSSDKVKCFSCHLEYSRWKDGDEPNTIHKFLSPNCEFMKGVDNNNVPIHWSSENVQDNRLFKTDECTGGAGWTETVHCERKNTNLTIQHQHLQVDSTAEAASTAVRRVNHKFPEHGRIEKRLESFKGWTSRDVIDPKILAEAGFFFTGIADCVRCFSCGGGIRNWKYGDSPWEEHARWFSWCRFLTEKKGTDFIKQYQEVQTGPSDILRRKEVNSGEEAIKTLEEHQNLSRDTSSPHTDKEDNEFETITKKVKEKLNEMGLPYSFDQIRTFVNQFKDIGHQDLTTEFIITNLIENQSNLENFDEQISGESGEGRNITGHQNVNSDSDKNNDVGTKKPTEDTDEINVQEENIQLKNQLMCKICMDSNSTVVFIPCGHMVSCENCAPNIRKCAICRLPIKGRVHAFTF